MDHAMLLSFTRGRSKHLGVFKEPRPPYSARVFVDLLDQKVVQLRVLKIDLKSTTRSPGTTKNTYGCSTTRVNAPVRIRPISHPAPQGSLTRRL